MSVFEITDDTVSVSRYDSQGVHNLKSAGVTNTYKGETGYEPNKTIYNSPQMIELTNVIDIQPIPDLIEQKVYPEGRYVRVTSSDSLKDGGQYLIVYNSSDDMIMLPKVNANVTERIGFDLESSTAFGGDVVKGHYSDKLWTFTKADNDGWLIGDGENYAKLTNTQNHKVTATLEETGSVFTIGGSADAYTFSDGTYVLNYNSRGLINGYSRDPATFYIYEYFPGVKPITKTSVASTGSSVNVEVVLDNVQVGSSLLVAGYQDDRLEEISHIITTSKTTESVSFETFVDTVKVFVWESIPSLKPITTVETVPTQLGK
jgi:hypothetical protein